MARVQYVVAFVGFVILATTVTLQNLFGGLEWTESLSYIGFLMIIIGLGWGLRGGRSDHSHSGESSEASYAAMTISVIFATFCGIVGIVGTISTGNPRFLVALVGTMVFAFIVVLLRREKARHDFVDMMTPNSNECPNCGHRVGRFERSCEGCGAIVWVVMRPRPGVHYRVPPRKRAPRTFLRARAGKTWRI